MQRAVPFCKHSSGLEPSFGLHFWVPGNFVFVVLAWFHTRQALIPLKGKKGIGNMTRIR